MPWSLGSSSAPSGDKDDIKSKLSSWTKPIRDHLSEGGNWIAPVIAAGATVGFWSFYKTYLRRIPNSAHVSPRYFHRRSLFGKVTSVGDGDGFHLYHTPGGRLAGWGWLRTVPKLKKELKGQTIPIRIAGVDAPEGGHFGRTAQPFAAEAQKFLNSHILNRRVRAYVWRRDQYDRIVATVYVRRPPFFQRKDVSMELLKQGFATTYEAKTGAEFGGLSKEIEYKVAEEVARQKGKGMWSLEKGGGFFHPSKKAQAIESPMAYKRRVKLAEKQQRNLDP
ncbi:putative endonuclease lcl3 [Podospora pseudopauciseta]|uniref:Probable endonuclease LCL3 n=1 Tax=Podospora pseudopauciseta TaxID=2093780 RepID=A0ABR0I1M0_9PEZI|nr:putative endonuclease lcl3 [Podospora pseudopauciseta]